MPFSFNFFSCGFSTEFTPCHAPRSLRNIERRYSQTEKEALAFVWVCKRYSIYVSGKNFELKTDHKLLERITSSA